MKNLPYRLGLPAWAYAGWRNTYLIDHPSMLSSYASVFNAVEGNTTFYHIPEASKVDAWVDALDGRDFHISFKLPRVVTHERHPDFNEFHRFLERIKPLKQHTGPFLLQFPEWVGMTQLRRLKAVFDDIASQYDAVIEVRNPALFAEPELLEPLLQYYGFGRVMLDSRALYQGDTQHPDVLAAVHEKPDVPVLTTLYNKQAFVRLILHPDGLSNVRWISEWAQRTATWISEGVTPRVMIHCPNNQYCPEFSTQFHDALMAKMGSPCPSLPPWPVPQQGQLI